MPKNKIVAQNEATTAEQTDVTIQIGQRVRYNGNDYEITAINAATCNLVSLEANETRIEVMTNDLEVSLQNIEKRLQNYENSILPNIVARKLKFAIVSGQAGLGKSYAVQKYLNDTNVILVKTKITPLQLYILLHDNRESTIIFDDLPQETFLPKSTQSELIKAATDTNDPRRLAWRSSSKLMEQYEPEFIFNGSILILTNLPLSFFDAATRNRAVCRSLHFSTFEKLQLLKKHLFDVAKQYDVTQANAKALFSELLKNLEFLKNDLSLRTLTKMFVEFNASGDVVESIENLKY